jgi:CTP synthase (UTP-ammonia lyase)
VVTRIAIIGEFSPEHSTHVATDAAFRDVESVWIRTDDLSVTDPASTLSGFDGLFVATGGPFASLDGALAAIRFARERGMPTLGTCAGFQHIVLEYARTVLGLDAHHAEYGDAEGDLVITPLDCSLVGQVLEVRIEPDTVAARAYDGAVAIERYYCNYGVDPAFQQALTGGGLRASGTDDDGMVRIVELPGHPFFVGTLFVPQATAPDHPLVTAFLAAAGGRG